MKSALFACEDSVRDDVLALLFFLEGRYLTYCMCDCMLGYFRLRFLYDRRGGNACYGMNEHALLIERDRVGEKKTVSKMNHAHVQ